MQVSTVIECNFLQLGSSGTHAHLVFIGYVVLRVSGYFETILLYSSL